MKKLNNLWKELFLKQHEVIVYDENGDELERTMQPLHVTHMTRWKHTFENYTTYSFNTHLDDGFVIYGMIPYPGFSEAKLN